MAASSSSPQHHLALPAPPNPRRLPPPCWSHEETIALIDAYRDKWYSLRRGNLRANHWQEVADDVAVRCPLSSPPKTSVQCRHKMEKLRKRYRTELQRASSIPNGHRCNSSWVHFKRMDAMEKGTSPSAVAVDSSPMPYNAGRDEEEEDEEENDDEDDEEEELYQSIRHGAPNKRAFHKPINNGTIGKSGFRIKIPNKFGGKPKANPNFVNPNANPNFGSTRVVRDGNKEELGMGKKRGGEAVGEMVSAIKALGDGFVRMETMKMEMARELEAMRMEMEMKRTEMILESQQRIVEAFALAFSDKRSKKPKRMTSLES